MHHGMWLASVFGPIMFLMGLWMLLRKHEVEKVWSSTKTTPGLLYLGASLNLIIGFAVLTTYREWSMHLLVLVTLFGYVQAIRGLLILFAHDWVMKVSSKVMRQSKFQLWGVLPLVWGLGMIFAGCCG